MTDGVSRARDSLLGTHTKNWRVASASVHVLSVCTRRLDHSLLWTAREAAKAAKLVIYIMDITLASVATIVSKPIYIPYTAGIQKSHATSELTIKILNHLHSCIWYRKLSIASRRIFPLPLVPSTRKILLSCETTKVLVHCSMQCQVSLTLITEYGSSPSLTGKLKLNCVLK